MADRRTPPAARCRTGEQPAGRRPPSVDGAPLLALGGELVGLAAPSGADAPGGPVVTGALVGDLADERIGVGVAVFDDGGSDIDPCFLLLPGPVRPAHHEGALSGLLEIGRASCRERV